jgi:hypothetical protein
MADGWRTLSRNGCFYDSHSGLGHCVFVPRQSPVGQGLHIVRASRSHSDTPHSVDSFRRVIGPTQRPLPDNTQHSQQTRHTRPPAGFEPTTPASERPHTHASDRAATGIGQVIVPQSIRGTPQKDPVLVRKPRKCREKPETIQHVTDACRANARSLHRRHSTVANTVHQELAIKSGLSKGTRTFVTSVCCIVLENAHHKLHCGRSVATEQTV